MYESGRRGGFGLRVLAVWTAAVALAALQCGCSGGKQETSQPPKRAASPAAMEKIRAGVGEANLIVIVLDSARPDHFGAYGYDRDTTTNIDALFAESIVFEQAYTQAPNTKASIASLFTSQSPTTHGVIGIEVALPPSTPTLPQVLSENGFRTVGFSANPFLSLEFGFGRGFDEFQEVCRDVNVLPNTQGHVPAELLGRAAVQWLEEHAEERFFAYLHFLEPHVPYTPPEPFASRYSGRMPPILKMMAAYDGNLAYVDSVVGEVLSALERLDLVEKSVIVLMSDHGEAFGEHGRLLHSDTIYEETAHIPLAIRLREACGVAPGRRSGIISTIDLMPTLL
ncbi:MAG: sulfatase, partial [Armatimonadetes bacterium]|nr:sulfatase [Armatimonadota bacterium]